MSIFLFNHENFVAVSFSTFKLLFQINLKETFSELFCIESVEKLRFASVLKYENTQQNA